MKMSCVMFQPVMHQQGVSCDLQVLDAKSYQDFSLGMYKY